MYETYIPFGPELVKYTFYNYVLILSVIRGGGISGKGVTA